MGEWGDMEEYGEIWRDMGIYGSVGIHEGALMCGCVTAPDPYIM